MKKPDNRFSTALALSQRRKEAYIAQGFTTIGIVMTGTARPAAGAGGSAATS
jgi:hypothetical protein